MDPLNSFVQAMAQSHALDANQLDEVRQLTPRYASDYRGLAAELLKRRWLTPFQINRLFAGRLSEMLLGSYVLVERVGEGGMGQVFKARNWKLGQTVALKLIRKELLTNTTVVARFRREIEATSQLNHPNIIRALDADQTDAGLFIAMEFVDGVDLAKRVKEQGPLSAAKACDYIRQAALGLQHAHERGLVHRDIKPNNLLLDGQTDAIKILDLGLARLQDAAELKQVALTQMGIIIGTVDFIAPEQARDSRSVDIRADLYALGCTFHFLLTGRAPYPGGTPTERIFKHTLEPLPPLLEVAPAVRAIVHRLMAKKAADRYQTPAELAQALETLLARPEKLVVVLSAEHLPPTEPKIHLAPTTRLVPELAGNAPIGGPVRRNSSRAIPKVKQSAGARPKLPAEAKPRPSRVTPMPRLPVAAILEEPRPVLIERPAARPRRRWRPLCVLLALVSLAALIGFPLLTPAPATQGETPAVDKQPPPEPVVWDGVVREFLVIGPFGRDSQLPVQIERDDDPSKVYQGDGIEADWRAIRTDERGVLSIAAAAYPKPAILFAQVHIHAATACKVKMLTGSADMQRVRLNGFLVHEWTAPRPQPRFGDDRTEVNLNAGWNQILIRLHARGKRDFEFSLGFKEAGQLRAALRPAS